MSEEIYRDFKKLLIDKLEEINNLEPEIVKDFLSELLELLKDD